MKLVTPHAHTIGLDHHWNETAKKDGLPIYLIWRQTLADLVNDHKFAKV